jgi:hypothetical protein
MGLHLSRFQFSQCRKKTIEGAFGMVECNEEQEIHNLVCVAQSEGLRTIHGRTQYSEIHVVRQPERSRYIISQLGSLEHWSRTRNL